MLASWKIQKKRKPIGILTLSPGCAIAYVKKVTSSDEIACDAEKIEEYFWPSIISDERDPEIALDCLLYLCWADL